MESRRHPTVPLVLGALALVASLVLLQKADFLRYAPFASAHEWNHPLMIASDGTGCGAILDGFGDRIVFLDGEGRVSGIVRKGRGADSFRRIASLAMASNVVYVVDCLADGGGKYAKSFRIARYSADGRYLGADYSETFPKPVPIVQVLMGATCHRGRLYGVALRSGRLKVVEIADGRLTELRDVPFDWRRVRGAWYVPGRDVLIVTTYAREVWLFEGGKEGRRVGDGQLLVQGVDVAPDGTCLLSDRSSGRVLELLADNTVRDVVKAEVCAFRLFGDRIVGVGYFTKPLKVFDLATGRSETQTVASFAPALVRDRLLAWGSLAVCLLAVLAAVIRSLAGWLRRRCASAAHVPQADRPLGMLPLYLSNLFVVGLAFAMVTDTLTVAHYREQKTDMRQIQRRVALTLYRLAPSVLGDVLERMDVSSDYDSPDYRHLFKVIAAIGNTGTDVDGDMDFMVLRLPRDA